MIKNPKTGRMVKRDGVIGKKVLQNAKVQKVPYIPLNLRKIIITKAGNATKKDAGIQNFNGRIYHNEALKVLPNWMIPRKESKSNAIEAWKSKMKKQTYTSDKRKDLNDIKDLFLSLKIIDDLNTDFSNSGNYYNYSNYYHANNIGKTKIITDLLELYELYRNNRNNNDSSNKYSFLFDKKTEKFKRITNIIPKLIHFNNGILKTTNLGKLYYKLLLNVPLNQRDSSRFQEIQGVSTKNLYKKLIK